MNFPKMFFYLFATTVLTSIVTIFIMIRYYKPTTLNATTSTAICTDFSAGKPSTLQMKLIKIMTQNYRDNQLVAIKNMGIANDAYSIWFSLKDIKEFSYHIENEFNTNNNSSNNTNDLGIRIYYSAYPEKAEWKNFPDLVTYSKNTFTSSYDKLHTLIMIPTIVGKEGENLDFNPSDSTTYNNGLDITNAASGSILSLGGMQSRNNTNAKNHGYLCPPGPTIGLAF